MAYIPVFDRGVASHAVRPAFAAAAESAATAAAVGFVAAALVAPTGPESSAVRPKGHAGRPHCRWAEGPRHHWTATTTMFDRL